MSAQSQQLFSNAFSGMEDALVNFVVTGKASFKDLATSIISDLARIAARQAITGLVGSLFSAGISGASSGASASSGNSFSSGAYNNLSFNAKGGVYDSPSLSAYSGKVYDSPQLFAFAKGAGVFGEAGPEAIMPLARGSDGSLGVRMINSGTSAMSGITVNAPVSIVQQSADSGAVNNSNTASTAKQLESIIQTTLSDRLRKEMSAGGLLYQRKG